MKTITIWSSFYGDENDVMNAVAELNRTLEGNIFSYCKFSEFGQDLQDNPDESWCIQGDVKESDYYNTFLYDEFMTIDCMDFKTFNEAPYGDD